MKARYPSKKAKRRALANQRKDKRGWREARMLKMDIALQKEEMEDMAQLLGIKLK